MNFKELWKFADKTYGSAVAEDDASPFVECPECGEPIFEEDYENDNTCHACGFDFSEDIVK